MAGYYRDIIQRLKDADWEFQRNGKGSHEIWWHPDTGKSLTIPRDCQKRHTANGILKDAGIDEKL